MFEVQDPQYKSADGSALRIWRDTIKNPFLTEREGRPIYDEAIFVEVIAPGSGNSAPVFEVHRKFAPEMGRIEPLIGMKYDEYKPFIEDFIKGEDTDASLAGTPLNQWREMPRTMIAQLKAAGVYTVDAVAALPDEKLPVVGPDGRMWRAKAQAYLENAKNEGYATQLASELETARTEKADLQDQVKALAAQVEKLQAAQGTGGKKAKGSDEPPTPPPADVPATPAPPAVDPITGEPVVAALETGSKSII